MVDIQEFRQLVMEDAASVKERQETDSIDIIDDIRYILVSLLFSFFVLLCVHDLVYPVHSGK